jgi:hypothetical protein
MAEVKNTLSSTIDNINHFDIPKASGVYKIVNIVNNKIYLKLKLVYLLDHVLKKEKIIFLKV